MLQKSAIKKQRVKLILPASLFYLLFPNLLFLAGWFKPIIAIPAMLLIGYAIYVSLKDTPQLLIGDLFVFFASKENLNLFLIATIVCLFTGSGLLLPQGDLPKHHAILKVLIEENWPVVLHSDDKTFYLVYYLAWYLPAALVGKIMGFNFAIVVLILESIIGLWLTLKWVLNLTLNKRNIIFTVLVFLLLEGQDSLFTLLKLVLNNVLGMEARNSQFLYDLTWQFSYYDFFLRKFSVAFDLAFVPQQVLGTWLATSLIINEIKEGKRLSNILFYFSLNALWSVLCTIGLLPIMAIGLFKLKAKGFFSKTNLLGGLTIGALLLFYFSAHLEIKEKGFIWEINPDAHWFLSVVAFITFEFGLYALFMHRAMMKSDWKSLWIISVFSLVVLSFYVLGTFNDLLMRATVPLHFVFLLCAIDFFNANNHKLKKVVMIILLVTSSLSFFLMETTLHYRNIKYGLPAISTNTLFNKVDEESWFLRQYMGDVNSIYGKYLSKGP